MVLTVTAPLWSDISDRTARDLGFVRAYQECTESNEALPMAGNDGIIVSSKPWWSRHDYGEICLEDDFEGTLKWSQIAGAVTKASDPTFVHAGTSAMKMVTGAVAADQAMATISLTPLIAAWKYKQIELWWAFSAAAATTPRDFYIKWNVMDRAQNNGMQFGLRYLNYDATVVQKKLQYWNAAGAWANFAPPVNRTVAVTSPMFKYVLFMIGHSPGVNYTYDAIQFDNHANLTLRGVAGQALAFDYDYQSVSLVTDTDAAFATTVYVDSFSLADGVYTI